ncbi:protein BatD [bacterium SCSIO 12741]|nr:protein BatD [bacterium SCSIO 12741]
MPILLKHITYLFLILGCTQLGWAQTFTTTVSSSKVGVGKQFKLTYTLDRQGTNFRAPALKNFRVLSGPNQAHNMSVYNGQMTQTLSVSYVLAPIKVGTYTIPGAEITADGKKVKANSVKVQVVKGAPKSQEAGANEKAQLQEIKDNVFIRLVANKTKLYQGEHLVATYKIYTRASIVDYSQDQVPAFNGFYTQEIESQQHGSLRPEVYKGVRYNAAVLRQVLLSPQRTGKLTLDPYSMNMVIRVRENRRPQSVYDQFFGSFKDIPYKAVSNTVDIEVLPLPSAGKPADFSGAVGHYIFSANLDKTEVEANEAINLKVTISGKGNIKLLKKPEISFPTDFEVYDPKINTQAKTSANGTQGTKTFEYLIIPRHAGEFKIPAIAFNYFDPKTGKYVKSGSEEFTVKVNRGSGDAGQASAYQPVSKKDVTLLGQDIRYIKVGSGKLKEQDQFFVGSALYYLLLLIPSVLFMLLLVVRRRLREQQADAVGMRRKRATRVAEKRLAQAKKHLDASEKNAFYEEVFRSLYGYLSDKFSISLSELNKDKLKEVLLAQGFEEAGINELFGLLDNCEMARYAPVAHIQEQQVYEEATRFINQIEGGKR